MTVRRVNLLPADIAVKRRVRRQSYMLGVIFGVFVLILIGFWFYQQMRFNEQQRLLAEEQTKVRQLETQVAALQEFAKLEESVVAKRTTLASAMVGDVAWSRLLLDLAMTIPGDSWITSFTGNAAQGAAPTGAPGVPPPPGPTVLAKLGTVQFSANTFDFPGVARWVTRLQGELKSLTNIWVPTAVKGKIGLRDTIVFSSTADLSSEAGSGRYQTQQAGATPGPSPQPGATTP